MVIQGNKFLDGNYKFKTKEQLFSSIKSSNDVQSAVSLDLLTEAIDRIWRGAGVYNVFTWQFIKFLKDETLTEFTEPEHQDTYAYASDEVSEPIEVVRQKQVAVS